jgi:hypothetical protein
VERDLQHAVEAAGARADELERANQEAEHRARVPWQARVESVRAEVERLDAEVQVLSERARSLEDEALRVRFGAGSGGAAARYARQAFVWGMCVGSTLWLMTLFGELALMAAATLPAAVALGRWWGGRRHGG